MKISIIFIYYVLFFHTLIAQTFVTGCIKDVNDSAISYANIILKPEYSDAITAYCIADEKGKYTLKISGIGNFRICVSSLSYQTSILNISITSYNQQIEKNIVLTSKDNLLGEVVIKMERPILIKNDTIIYDAKAFTKGDEQVVEDLLKKLPGITVENDGTIKIGDKEIEKIMVEGDDFFDQGYRVLSKNMPPSPIKKVEIVQHFSDNNHLKGIENSDKVALNLRLDASIKRKWFGNIDAGYAIAKEIKYKNGFNMMKFGKKSKYYFLGNCNNIGYDATGDLNQFTRPFRTDESTTLGDNQISYELINLISSKPKVGEERTNMNNDKLLSLNAIFQPSSKIKFKTVGFISSTTNEFFNAAHDLFLLDSNSFINNQNSYMRKNKITGFGKLDFSYDISANQTIEYSIKTNASDDKYNNEMVFNSNAISERLQNNHRFLDHKLVFANNYGKQAIYMLTARYIKDETPQAYSIDKFLYADLFPMVMGGNNLQQNSRNIMELAGIEANIKNRKSKGNLLEFAGGDQYRNDLLLSVFKINKDDSIIANPIQYQNNINYLVNDFYMKAKYLIRKKAADFITSLEAHQLYNQLLNNTDQTSNRQHNFYLIPIASVVWKINEKNKIKTMYTYQTTNTKLTEVYGNFINTGFRTFEEGMGVLNQLNQSTILFQYTLGNWSDKFFAQATAMAIKNYDFLSTNTLVTQNYSQIQKILTKDRQVLYYSSNIDRYFSKISSNIKIQFSGSSVTYKNIVNNSNLREINSNTMQYGFKMRSVFKGIFNYHIGTTWTNNKIASFDSNISFTDNDTYIDLGFTFSKKLNMQIQTERYFFGNLSRSSNKYYFMDIKGSYIVKPNKLIFKIAGKNLFNTETFQEYFATDISIHTSEYRLQSRYILLSVECRF